MGLAQVYAGMTANNGWLNMEKCTHVGIQKTYSADSYITDSGAGGTAIASGVKTFNGAVGVDTAGHPVHSILEIAEQNGLATGLVATSAITHATPAAFIAHQSNRNSYEDIAMDFTRTDVDVIIGGGLYHFSKRQDSLDLTEVFRHNGYQVIHTIGELSGIENGKVLCLTDSFHLLPARMGRGDMLPVATEQAIKLLNRQSKGFFMMVEGSQIDWGCHQNNTDYVVTEVLDFDIAVGKALEFAQKDGETLVVITGDHETGGMAITSGDFRTGTVEAVYGTEDHTAVMIPVFAFGPGAELFSGIYENTDIFRKMKEALGL
jgi:alkaline phosphatase